MSQNIVIIGSAGHAKVCIDVFEKFGKYKIVGLIDSFRNPGETTFDYKILGKETDLSEVIINYEVEGCFIAIGDNWQRKLMHDKLLRIKPDLQFVSAIHPSAQIGKKVEIGKGVIVMAGTVINSGSFISDFTLINTKASVDHDCIIGEFAGIAPNAVLGGYVNVGDFSVVAIGATVLNKVNIGKHSIVGAGSLLLKDIDDYRVAYGVPAKIIRNRLVGEKYLH